MVDSPPLILYVRRVRALPIIILDFFVDTVYVAVRRVVCATGRAKSKTRLGLFGPEQYARSKNEAPAQARRLVRKKG